MSLPGPQTGGLLFRRGMGGEVEIPARRSAVQIAPSQPGALGPQTGQYVRLPGASFAPAGATPVDETGDGNIAPSASAVLVSVVVPDGQTFRMAGIGFGADDETCLAFLTWSIQLGNDPVPGYVIKPATVGSLQYLADIFVVVGSSATVNVVGTPLAAAATTYRYICRLRGWFYAEREGSV